MLYEAILKTKLKKHTKCYSGANDEIKQMKFNDQQVLFMEAITTKIERENKILETSNTTPN